jgi:hypothetical protein
MKGWVRSPFTKRTIEPRRRSAGHCARRRFLASSNAGLMTGETLYISGGNR